MKFLKIIALLFLLQGCSSNYEWGWYILSPENIEGLTNLKFLISGITTTIYISVVSIILAMIIGLIVALPSLSNNKFLSYFNITYVEIVRAIPLLVLIVFLALLNIKSSFNAERLLKKSINLEREVADLRLTYITSKSDLMILYRRSNFENVVKDLGLKTSIIPPEIIER